MSLFDHIPYIGPLWKFRKAIGIAVAALAVIWAIHSYGSRRYDAGRAAETAKWEKLVADAKTDRIASYEAQIIAANAAQAKAQADSAALAGKLTDAATLTQTLQTALTRARLVSRETSPIPGCPDVPRLSRGLRVCLNAASTGAASAAQDCEAAGVRVPGTP